MTLPHERTLAVTNTRAFLLSLLDPKQTPRVPKAIRMQARSLLKHYPNDFYLMEIWLDDPPSQKVSGQILG